MEFELIRSQRKTLAVEIKGDRLMVRAPVKATKAEINAFLLRNQAWI